MLSQEALSRLQEASAGAVGAAISTTVLYPLEIAKTIMVSRTGKETARDSTMSILANLVQRKGVVAVYQGWPTKTAQSVVQAFGYFYFYAAMKQLLQLRGDPTGAPRDLSTLENLLAGYLGGVLNIGATLPLEVLATRLQVADANASLLTIIQEVYHEHGLQGFFKGFSASVILCVNPAITNTVFDQLRLRWLATSGTKSLTAGQAFLLGVIAKVVATLCTYPLTRAKTIVQSGSMKQALDKGGRQESSALHVMQRIVEDEGVSGLFKGLQSQLFRTVLASALMLTVKERVSTRTAIFLNLLMFVLDNPAFVYGMLKSRVKKAFA